MPLINDGWNLLLSLAVLEGSWLKLTEFIGTINILEVSEKFFCSSPLNLQEECAETSGEAGPLRSSAGGTNSTAATAGTMSAEEARLR